MFVSGMEGYKTLSGRSEAVLREKGSRFLAFAFPIADENEFRTELERLKKTYFDATHHCYAYALPDGKTRAYDDGEPTGTAGLPILQQVRARGLSGVAVVVVRYFGGTKLGTHGLVQAYKTAAQMALSQAPTKDVWIAIRLTLRFPVHELGTAMRLLKFHDAKILNQSFEDNWGQIDFEIQKSYKSALQQALNFPLELLTTIEN